MKDDDIYKPVINSTKPPIAEEIDEWQSVPVDKKSHIKYQPNKPDSRSQLEAILNDINEDPRVTEENLNKSYMKEELLSGFAGIGDFSGMGGGENADLDSLNKKDSKFTKDERRKKEVLSHQENLKGK